MEISAITKVVRIEIALDDDTMQRRRVSLSMDEARSLWRRIGLLLGEDRPPDIREEPAPERDYVEWRSEGGE